MLSQPGKVAVVEIVDPDTVYQVQIHYRGGGVSIVEGKGIRHLAVKPESLMVDVVAGKVQVGLIQRLELLMDYGSMHTHEQAAMPPVRPNER